MEGKYVPFTTNYVEDAQNIHLGDELLMNEKEVNMLSKAPVCDWLSHDESMTNYKLFTEQSLQLI